MSYKLFLDDERFPPDDGEHWEIARCMYQARVVVSALGCPHFISFDHDLGHGNGSGKEFADWLIERDMDRNGAWIPEDFTFYVHSQNPVGAENISTLLENYLQFRRSNPLT